MVLEDVASGTYTWDSYLEGEFSEIITSLEVGTGAENTRKILERLGNGTVGNLWEIEELQNKVAEGWYVPSRAEWAAFADAFDITGYQDSSNPNYYANFELCYNYWSSSQANSEIAWSVNFYDGCIYRYYVYNDYCVRLGGTF